MQKLMTLVAESLFYCSLICFYTLQSDKFTAFSVTFYNRDAILYGDFFFNTIQTCIVHCWITCIVHCCSKLATTATVP